MDKPNKDMTPNQLPRNLAAYDNSFYSPGRGKWTCVLWYFASLLLVESGWLPISKFKVVLLRLFGADIGEGVTLKPHVKIKYPWRLKIGDHSWIGEQVWIDNLDQVTIGDHVCVSQGAYFCTGSHDHRSPTFELRTRPISVGDGAWIACKTTLLGGASVGCLQIISAGEVVK